jgi:transcriptional regulator with XRE-family HTH domain
MLKIPLDRLYMKLYNVMAMKRDLIAELEEYRLKNRITQVELAKLLGVTFATVSRWLNRHATPNKIHEYHIRRLLKGVKE